MRGRRQKEGEEWRDLSRASPLEDAFEDDLTSLSNRDFEQKYKVERSRGEAYGGANDVFDLPRPSPHFIAGMEERIVLLATSGAENEHRAVQEAVLSGARGDESLSQFETLLARRLQTVKEGPEEFTAWVSNTLRQIARSAPHDSLVHELARQLPTDSSE